MEANDDHSENEAKQEIQKNTDRILEPISTIQLLASRNQALYDRKLHIGILSSGFLENPEEKVTNLRTLLNLLDEEIPEIHYSVKKLVIISLLEIFKDILPSYEIKSFSQEGVKCKYQDKKCIYHIYLLCFSQKGHFKTSEV